MKQLILLVIVLSGFNHYAWTQADTTNTSQLYVITKNDGLEYIGKILSDDGREVLIETVKLGKIYIPKSDIKSIVKIEDENSIVNGEYRTLGPFTTRYSFTTNALPIQKGENYALVNLYGPEVHFAVSNNLSLGIMSTWIASPFVLAAKYSIKTKNEKVNISIGTLFGTSGYLNTFRGYGGLHFANITFGSRESNVTLAAGYTYVDPGWNNSWRQIPAEGTYVNSDSYPSTYNIPSSRVDNLTHGPIFSIAGITKAGKKASFFFDSMIGIFGRQDFNVQTTTLVPESYNPIYTPGSYEHVITHSKSLTTAFFIMPGMRFQSTDRRAFQVSLAGVTAITNGNVVAFPVPMCAWFFKF